MDRKAVVSRILERHDMVYDRPAVYWEQGIPMGNGLLGTVLWGNGDPLKLSLDRMDIWDTRNWRPREGDNWQAYKKLLDAGRGGETTRFGRPDGQPHPTRIPVGRLELMPAGKPAEHRMRLHLEPALASGRLETDHGALDYRTFVAADEQVIVFEGKTSGRESVAMRFKLLTRRGDYAWEDTAASRRCEAGMTEQNTLTAQFRAWGYPDAELSQRDDVRRWRQVIPEGGEYAVAILRTQPEPDRFVLFACIEYDRGGGDAVQAAYRSVRRAQKRGLEALLEAHAAWWKDYFPRSFLSIPDTRLEGYYWTEIYKLGCLARPGGIHMCIQGPWMNDDNLWLVCDNDYHWNMQQPENLWPVYTANRLEFGLPLFDMLEKQLPVLRANAMENFGGDGAVLAHCTDVDFRPTRMNPDNFSYSGMPWACWHYWLHYQYTLDTEFLRNRAYPMLKLALAPLLGELTAGGDGFLHLPWCNSPEYHSEHETYRWYLNEGPDWAHRFGPDATIDLSLVKFLLRAVVEASRTLETDAEQRPGWQETLDRMAPYTVDRIGSLQVRADLPLRSSHRHLSHLFPIHPLHEITLENNPKLVEKSLDVLDLNGHGEWLGWSMPWASLLYAYGGRPLAARNLLLDLLDRFITEGGMHLNAPIGYSEVSLHAKKRVYDGQTVEGGLGAAAAIQELLLQSVGGVIKIFSVSPPGWSEAVIGGMRCEGAFLVDAVRDDYRTRFVRIFSEKGGIARIETDFGPEVLHGEADGMPVAPRLENGRVLLELRPGETVLLWAGDRPDLSMNPVPAVEHECHFFGVKRVRRFW